jgi:hypothetical protein
MPTTGNTCGAVRAVTTWIMIGETLLARPLLGAPLSDRFLKSGKIDAVTKENDFIIVTRLEFGGASAREIDDLSDGGDVIGIPELSGWFGSNWLKPQESDLLKLAKALNVMRITARRVDPVPLARKQIKGALVGLIDQLPILIEAERQKTALPEMSPAAVVHGNTIQGVFRDLQSAAVRANKFLGNQRPEQRITPWFGDALWIGSFLRMLGAGSDRPVALTKAQCPGVEFIEHALARAGAEHVTRDAIAKQMSRHRKSVES